MKACPGPSNSPFTQTAAPQIYQDIFRLLGRHKTQEARNQQEVMTCEHKHLQIEEKV